MCDRLQRCAHDLSRHKLLTVRAIFIGWTAVFLLWTQLAWRIARLDEWLFVTGLGDYRWLWNSGSGAVSHFLIGATLNAAAGWIVGRLHRPQKVATVTAFFASFVLIADGSRLMHVLVNPDDGNIWRGLAICAVDFVFLSLPILAAGIWGVRDSISPTGHVEV